ncbi:MAG TPA: molybdate ABC transporter substrate-binding protein [Spirochaetota bacterium]|nr:molybdate ABC transporter substrate-binding protein [Spirochaetota bacterium]HPJ35105.1 molybdate ABC transporter substrate-binding protein [Spirochaetota bacterium]
MKSLMSKSFYSIIILSFIVCTVAFMSGCKSGSSEKIYIYAAASTTDATTELVESYKKTGKAKADIKISFASSGSLAKQIEAGAEADVYISANMKWFKHLEEKNLVEEKSDFILAKNSLVIIASQKAKAGLNSPEQLAEISGDGHIAMGEPSHVPAGKYGQEALEHFKVWDKLSSKKKLAFYPDVRKTLNSVETSQADYGIVYKTDALTSQKINVVYTFPEGSHKPIAYPVCALKGKNKGDAQSFLEYLKTAEAKDILKKYGFEVK